MDLVYRAVCTVGCIAVFTSSIHKGLALKVTNTSLTVKHVIDNLLDHSGYDPTIRPFYDLGKSVQVEVDLVLNTLGPVIEREMQMSASFYLRQQWQDPRLAFNDTGRPILLNHRRLDSIWVPDLFFSQSKTEMGHVVTVPNLLIRLYPDGTILFSQRLSVTYQCIMDLRKFPLDHQICYIRMESYSHTTDDMFFIWSKQRKSMEILENAHIPDFELTAITTHDCTATYATGTFPCLEARLKLHRQIGFYMTQSYIPSVMIVSLSWVSFWLDPQAVPARISVGLLTVLTITTQSSGIRSELPRVPYTKSIDIWMSVCLVFVFTAYMEYALVTICSRRQRKQKSSDPCPKFSHNIRAANFDDSVRLNNVKISTSSEAADELPTPPLPSTSSANDLRKDSKSSQSAPEVSDRGRLVDKWSRYLFPLSFVLFNVGYWVYYTQSSDAFKMGS